ncbi:type II toxin-antitoxin system CcdA family antitoxin [Aurantimonas sp. VKM B-3413]|uniref:type II toxin-antitoxin system CcdA family antitoxin n=1 Tax=Aurantimonas sp. VKM B-3413 TaxID=2779401 RepID=UPI001E5D847D|nr:type II toxin-antitoxin system CcdA family antitoxin [Aurantimonas sp. VKM B-3413]
MNDVVIDPALLAEAEELKVDISKAASKGVAQAVRASRQTRWRDANADALTSSNDYVERSGLPLERYRLL